LGVFLDDFEELGVVKGGSRNSLWFLTFEAEMLTFSKRNKN
jgi:hypothetical protein